MWQNGQPKKPNGEDITSEEGAVTEDPLIVGLDGGHPLPSPAQLRSGPLATVRMGILSFDLQLQMLTTSATAVEFHK